MGPPDVYLDSPIDTAHPEPWKILNQWRDDTTNSFFEFPILGRLRRTSGYEPVHELSTFLKIYQSLFGSLLPAAYLAAALARSVTE